ncbi:MAG: Type II secretory pathway component PulK-like protein, partial [Brevundimonas sp.]
TAPQSDNAAEPWSQVGQNDIAIAGGRFRLSVHDAQDRFNINNLRQGGVAAQAFLARLLAYCGVEVDPAAVAAYVQLTGPLADIASLRVLGVEDRKLACLGTVATALPSMSTINLNSATEPVVEALVGDRATAALLIAQRRRQGLITEADLAAAKVIMPLGAGFTSNFFVADTQVTVGQTATAWTTLLQRTRVNGRPDVVSVGRKKQTAEPVKAPPL